MKRVYSNVLKKVAKYNTNQKNNILYTFHQAPILPNEVIDFILETGENKEQRRLKLETTIKDIVINYNNQIELLYDKNDKLRDQIIATIHEVHKYQQEVTATQQKVTATQQEVTATQQKVTEFIEKWKETQIQLILANMKILTMNDNFNVKGAVQFVSAEILGKIGLSEKSKEIWDDTLSDLLKDKHFKELLKEYSITQNVQYESIEKDLQGLYYTLSTYPHSGNKCDIIVDDFFSLGEQIILVALFERYNIPYYYKDKYRKLVSNPFKMK